MKFSPVHVITGPTASGKSALGLRIALDLGGEIVSADSRQIYRELSVGAAKPTVQDLNQVPHHFINELSLGQPYSAGLFASQASARIHEIVDRGRVPIVIGGSTLYLHALVHGLSPSIPSDPRVRADLERRLIEQGNEILFEELLRVDPQLASTMDPTKSSRIMRALEVFELTGTPLSEYHRMQMPPVHPYSVTVLTMDRPVLYQRIEKRVDAMLESGLMDEIRKIRALKLDPILPALKSIGYQEPFAYLDGRCTWDEMVSLIKRNSRRYAKRQLTWFRRYPSYRRIDAQCSFRELVKSFMFSGPTSPPTPET